MATIHITQKHSRDETDIHRQIHQLAELLATKLSASYQWQGGRLTFQRKGAKGYIEQRPGEVTVNLELGIALKPLRGKIETTIRDYLNDNLA